MLQEEKKARYLKRFEGYYQGILCYEWEVYQDEYKIFHFTVNGCRYGKYLTAGEAMKELWFNVKDFLIYENYLMIEIRGVANPNIQ